MPCETCQMDTCVCGREPYSEEEEYVQVIDHTTACIMDGMPECSCPASTVRIRI